VITAASMGVSGTPSIPTFVIGVFSPEETSAPMNLDRIATAGGSDAPFIVSTTGDVTQEFVDALNQIRSSRLSCEYQLPDPPADQSLDFSRINVDFTNDGSVQRLTGVADAASCDPTSGGWYYDQNPSKGNPTKIVICPASCTSLQAAKNGSVQVALGCETKLR
jgi:hypothetical protein